MGTHEQLKLHEWYIIESVDCITVAKIKYPMCYQMEKSLLMIVWHLQSKCLAGIYQRTIHYISSIGGQSEILLFQI